MVPPLPLKPPPPLSPMAVFSISTPINQCYCLCHHGNWTCCISLRSGGVFHNSQTDGSRGCSRSASPPSAKSAPRETQNPPLSASPSTHDRLTAAPPPPPHHSLHYGLRDYITATTVWVSSHKATVYIIEKNPCTVVKTSVSTPSVTCRG